MRQSGTEGCFLTRRGFLALAGGAAAGHLLGAGASCADSYTVAVLGDTHYDSTDPQFYHKEYTSSTTVARWKRHLAEHRRNAEMWAERMPKLIRASAAAVRPDTAFVLQLGDLVQGDCNNAATHRRMLEDMLSFAERTYGPKLPFVSVVGNHDIRGKKAKGVYDSLMPARMAKTLRQPVSATTFAFRQGPDVFLAIDFNSPRPSLAHVKKLLEETKDARHTFVVSHGPVVPSGTSRWFLCGEVARDAERRELRALLAARQAIVLAGHTHRLEYHDCRLPEGRITQFVANSVWTEPEGAALEVLDEGRASYGNRLPAGQGGAKDARKNNLSELVDEYRPLIGDYFYGRAAGHYRLSVSAARVAVEFFAGDAAQPTRTFVLRG